MNNKKNQLISLTVISAILLSACQAMQANEESTVPEIVPQAGLIAEGTFEPTPSAELAFGTPGIVSQIFIEEGERVQKGNAIARLDACDLIEADLSSAQADLIDLQQELSDLELYADFERAQALQALIDAQEAFDEAQLDWDDYDYDAYEDDLGEAQEDVQEAQENLDEAISDLESYLDLEEDNPTRKRYQDDVDDARKDLHRAQQDLNEVQNDYLQAKHDYDLAAGKLKTAQAEYHRKLEGPDEYWLASLQSRITALENTITGLKSSLASCQIISPIDGILLFNELQEGEFINAGDARVMVAEIDHWQVKTDDVSEYDVANILADQAVEVTADALPSVTLEGTVESIDRVATLDHGDVTYTVTISILDTPPELRWGMTANVYFKETE